MKSKVLISVLCVEAVACILFFSVRASFAGVFSTVITFPFEQIGLALRFLSLSDEVGSVCQSKSTAFGHEKVQYR